jgi:hypothetical protein
MTTMAPPKKGKAKGGRPRAEVPKRRVVSFRCSDEFGDWFDELSAQVRIPPASVIELALIRWAKEQGYKPEPPVR